MSDEGPNYQENQVKESECPAGEHVLENAWTFWYDRKSSNRKESDAYVEGLQQIGTFETVEGFYRHYAHFNRPHDLPRDINIHCFRKGCKPMWEEFPDGGCWILRIKKKASVHHLHRLWENLVMACVGESFENPDVVGCVLSTRIKDDVISVWNANNQDNTNRYKIGEKLKEILDLDVNTVLQYKDHMSSMKDYSTYRNARNYTFASTPMSTPGQGPMTPQTLVLQDSGARDSMMLPPAHEDSSYAYSSSPQSKPRTSMHSPAMVCQPYGSMSPFVGPEFIPPPPPPPPPPPKYPMPAQSPYLTPKSPAFSPSFGAKSPAFSPSLGAQSPPANVRPKVGSPSLAQSKGSISAASPKAAPSASPKAI